ncbi:hypothetical protein CCUG60885_03125 [Mycobacteroides salmoniphilum]|uniref:Uncharacterized protein n=1 Tax=Mycobacteroides salmoniphilum TaxID=404941 RepID=A0A4R8SDH8_9MYCO|nr:hypothetical protein CCUG60885_03125 [Mycobacteroides salmoniphilum]TEA09305.1 hypothetical protein CCUG60883_00066 [Mycobacteroides salmoniphilum]
MTHARWRPSGGMAASNAVLCGLIAGQLCALPAIFGGRGGFRTPDRWCVKAKIEYSPSSRSDACCTDLAFYVAAFGGRRGEWVNGGSSGRSPSVLGTERRHPAPASPYTTQLISVRRSASPIRSNTASPTSVLGSRCAPAELDSLGGRRGTEQACNRIRAWVCERTCSRRRSKRFVAGRRSSTSGMTSSRSRFQAAHGTRGTTTAASRRGSSSPTTARSYC